MAAIGRMKSPTWFFLFNPPHFPRKRTAFGLTALSRSMMVAAFELPMPKSIMVIPFAVAQGMLASGFIIETPINLAK